MLRQVLKRGAPPAPQDAFEATGSLPHGYAQAALWAMSA